MTDLVFLGPFLTRAQVARRARLSSGDVALRPDLLRLRGRWLQETYFEFQFDERGIRHDLARVVLAMRSRFTDDVIADWLVRPNPQLGGYSPVDRPRGDTNTRLLLAVAKAAGPAEVGAIEPVEAGVAPPPRPAPALPAPVHRLAPTA